MVAGQGWGVGGYRQSGQQVLCGKELRASKGALERQLLTCRPAQGVTQQRVVRKLPSYGPQTAARHSPQLRHTYTKPDFKQP